MTDAHTPATSHFRLDGVWFRYTHLRSTREDPGWVLRDVSFALGAGEILGMIGPNGSGKSTLVKIMAGLHAPQRGAVYLGDRPLATIGREEAAHRVAAVFQDAPIGFPFTAAEIVLMGRYPHRRRARFGSGWAWDTAADRAHALRAMQEMEVAHLADQPIDRLSSGERQRVFLARALAQATPIVLLDESTAHLDAHHLVGLATRLRSLNRARGLSIVLVTHDVNLACQLCTRLLLLAGGRIVAMDTPHAVLRPEVLAPVYGSALAVESDPSTGVPHVALRMPPA